MYFIYWGYDSYYKTGLTVLLKVWFEGTEMHQEV